MQQTHTYAYDAFISHAVEDKLAIANELCERLEKEGLKIWYSGKELSVGDSVQSTIEEGLRNSRFGIVIFSKNYVEKCWPMRELFFFFNPTNREKRLLPVLFDITVEELAAIYPPMADIYALKYERGMDYVVAGLLKVIKSNDKTRQPAPSLVNLWRRWLAIIAVTLTAVIVTAAVLLFPNNEIPQELLNETIAGRISNLDERVRLDLHTALQTVAGNKTSLPSVDSAFVAYHASKSNYRNEYFVHTGYVSVKSKKNVEALLNTDVDVLRPSNGYGLKNAEVYRFPVQQLDTTPRLHFGILNTDPAIFTITDSKRVNKRELFVTVDYTNNVRFITVEFHFPKNGIKRQSTTITALPPREVYHFRYNGDTWELVTIE